ncbi:exonuclease [Nitrososphaeria virus YSH_462411]|uniref:Exonuclease n=1 Tax=Nitrososphaeria virus YSH_462411 TaxID=3071321 RepID=A0A976UAI7_9CAUD|nr:exonuclease [Yangshan Harbor Nitrososphaeria virus]UVF62326.1 exonuclease [Nitrososphaeria virus YSH_462411]
MFNHIPIKINHLIESAHEENKHYYKIDQMFKFPSITTILHSFPNEGINIWKRKTPNWEEIQKESFKIGTDLHSTIEAHLKNNPFLPLLNDKAYELFCNLIPELDKINNIQCLETYLYEPELKIAGCTDCIAEYEGEKCIIDFKNSRKPKREKWINDYKLQVTAYSKMFEYCTEQKIDLGIILIANWDGSTDVFKVNIPDHEENLINMLDYYYSEIKHD